jgi:1-deoxy-D-xylulose-5-phosphate reductoisomerase
MTAKRRVTILGATGSVGRSTLDLIERAPERFEVVALTANSDAAALAEAAGRTGAKRAVIADPAAHAMLAELLAGTGIEVASGPAAVVEAAEAGADWTMAAIVGSAGLKPVLAALEAGSTVALANKEALVCAGGLVAEAAARGGGRLLPVDSEHNAVFQCFDHDAPERVRRIILTASGGPFRDKSLDEMRTATPAEAVRHPVWSMGAKISVDSATLMNKGLELIEAHHLFPVRTDQLDIIIHPQSVIHSMVEYVDGSVLAQLGTPDMRTPIAHALAWPDRMATPCEPLDLARIGRLEFVEPSPERFPALRIARAALEAGGARPASLNAANEIAVAAFLAGRIGFLDIVGVVTDVLDRYDPPPPSSLDDVLAVDAEARRLAEDKVAGWDKAAA